MKKLVCLLLVLIMCVGSACAETVMLGDLMLNSPAQWRAECKIYGYYA